MGAYYNSKVYNETFEKSIINFEIFEIISEKYLEK
jgi:hypothetical protein